LNLGALAIFSLTSMNIMISIPLFAYAVSQYDSEGFTIFAGKSVDYMNGYRSGVIQAHEDIANFDKLGGIDARQENIKCPAVPSIPEFCNGYRDGYSDEAMSELD
jgi:hypothetical protein